MMKVRLVSVYIIYSLITKPRYVLLRYVAIIMHKSAPNSDLLHTIRTIDFPPESFSNSELVYDFFFSKSIRNHFSFSLSHYYFS